VGVHADRPLAERCAPGCEEHARRQSNIRASSEARY
jgi:hypothetical protein